MRGLPLFILATVMVGCSLIVAPDSAVQCDQDLDCTGQLAGRVCREGFCVLADAASGDDTSRDAASGDGGDNGNNPDGGASGEGDLLAPGPGDVVMLMPNTIEATGNGTVTSWNNAVPGQTLRKVVAEDLPSVGRPTVRERGGHNCVAIARYQRMVLPDDAAGDFAATEDFSVLAVVLAVDETRVESNRGGVIPVGRFTVSSNADGYRALGWGLRTAWQSGDGTPTFNRFGASIEALGGVMAASSALEVIDPQPHDEQLHVLALAVRDEGARKVHLWVDGVERGSPASFDKAQPPSADLTLGSILDPPYQWAAFEGDLCAVIVHHGAESPEAFKARMQALKTKFGIL